MPVKVLTMPPIPNYRRDTGEPIRTPWRLPRWLGGTLLAVTTLALMALIAGPYTPAVLGTLAAYLTFVLCVLLPAGVLGWAATAPLAASLDRCGWPVGYRLILAVALGLGFLSLGMLLLGSAGLLHHGIPLALPILAAALGFFPVLESLRRSDGAWLRQRVVPYPLLLAACVPVALLLVAVTFPVGALWNSEGRGYDVMLYHLQLPREYLLVNSTAPLQHNVYSFLPANMEMLYTLLLALVQAGFGPGAHLHGIYAGQLLHACLTILAAAAVALAPLRCGALARVVAFTLVLGIPWTLVVGSLAYNDGAVLLYGALAIGLALLPFSGRQMITIGVLLGLAVGCKMTAGVMLALPVAGLLALHRRWRGLLVVGAVAVVLYLPWAARAMVYTQGPGQVGNPLFPIAANVLGRGHWSPEQVERWNRGHSPQQRIVQADGTVVHVPLGLGGRLAALVHETLLDPQWSPGLWRLARWAQDHDMAEAPVPLWTRIGLLWLAVPLVLLLAATRSLAAWQLLLVLALQVAGWLFCTHLQARFLLPAIIPMALLFGLAAERFIIPRAVIVGIVALQAALCAFLLLPETRLFAGGPPGLRIGQFYFFPAEWSTIPGAFPESTVEHLKTYLIGPPMGTPLYLEGRLGYNSVWDTNAWAEQLRCSPAHGMAWLRQQGYNFVVIDWNEVTRLRSTYGFDPLFTPDLVHSLIPLGLQPANRTYAIRGVDCYELLPELINTKAPSH